MRVGRSRVEAFLGVEERGGHFPRPNFRAGVEE